MGEYSIRKSDGENIKIGTCENMYYLRADQAHLVQATSGNVDPIKDASEIRFRFPWPDEDNVAPGEFDQYDRRLGLYDVELAQGFEHGRVQFTAPGYNVTVPCPEDEEGPASDHGLTFKRNGHPGKVQIVQQKYVGDLLVLVCACGGCGARYRLQTLEDAKPVISAVRKLAERARHEERLRQNREAAGIKEPASVDLAGAWFDTVADRIEAGYSPQPARTSKPTKNAELVAP